MAFVIRGERKTSLSKPINALGPGSYDMDLKQIKKKKLQIPFGSLSPRAQENETAKLDVPGPGAYTIMENQNGEKLFISNENEDIKILQISRPNHVFKSGTDRFMEFLSAQQTPGPGQYASCNTPINRQKMFSTNTNSITTQNKPNILEHLINLNRYQSIPSIPSNLHSYGYNENQKNQLELNQSPIQTFQGQKDDKIGPNHYSLQGQKVKGTSLWSHAKEKRWKQGKENQKIGPGSYNPNNVISLCNCKRSAGFINGTLRYMDQGKNLTNPKENQLRNAKVASYNYSNQIDSRIHSEKQPLSTKIDQSENSYEYIPDTTPGPGSYLQISEQKKIKSEISKVSFGISSKRFQIQSTSKTVGPGSYNLKQLFKKEKQKKIHQVKEIKRFPELTNQLKAEKPGPGAYQPKCTIEDKLSEKIQKGYKGLFGSSEPRSKEPEDNQNPGPGQYNIQKKIVKKKVQLSVFKSKSRRKGISIKEFTPGVGKYNIDNHDIENRIKKEEEDDPDLVIKKPGFGVGAQRFTRIQKKDDYEDKDIIRLIQDKYQESKKRKIMKQSPPFENKNPRLEEIKNQTPGPGAYYQQERELSYWEKRTDNVLFKYI